MNQLNVLPVHIEISERNPENVYRAVREENSYLLESCEGVEKVARYSFIGFNPVIKIVFKDGKPSIKTYDSNLVIDLKGKCGNPVDFMKNILMQFKRIPIHTPRFIGGFVGYFSYDIIRYFIDVGGNTNDDLKHPDCEFILTKNNILFDHKLRKTYLISYNFDSIDEKSAIEELEEMKDRISDVISNTMPENENNKKILHHESNMTRDEFERGVKIIKEYIKSGDVFQVVLSQRIKAGFKGDKFHIYQRLKRINPSPYMYFLDFGDRKIVGSSPEMLVRVENRNVETYPIAGTRRRGKTPMEDKRLEVELLSDEKERAEHVMLVDLGRNDIGRVCEFGSVKVKNFMKIEKYSHVQHIISEITGKLRDDEDEFSALKAVFPAGTVSGAPKVRAMEIIDELEPTRRGIYAGCVGYFSFNGNMDTAITIRTIDFEKDNAFIQVGAGIVTDSKPEREYEETMNKCNAMLKALNLILEKNENIDY
ncbi:MAG: anthranilate synthase component I [Candidatus Altiarchaeales archaeon]|nr:MAG: anthranilate synthase component I [Candidatus Altiarchaeales archaeon]